MAEILIRTDAIPLGFHPQALHQRDEASKDLRNFSPNGAGVYVSNLEARKAIRQPLHLPKGLCIHEFTVRLKIDRMGFNFLQHSLPR